MPCASLDRLTRATDRQANGKRRLAWFIIDSRVNPRLSLPVTNKPKLPIPYPMHELADSIPHVPGAVGAARIHRGRRRSRYGTCESVCAADPQQHLVEDPASRCWTRRERQFSWTSPASRNCRNDSRPKGVEKAPSKSPRRSEAVSRRSSPSRYENGGSLLRSAVTPCSCGSEGDGHATRPAAPPS